MKLIIRIVAIGTLTYFLSPLLPWWVAMVIAFLVSYISPSSGLNAFIAGFLGVGLVWMGHAWQLDIENTSQFSKQIAEVMTVGESMYLVFGGGIVGGFAGAFSSLTGTFSRAMFQKPKNTSLYTS